MVEEALAIYRAALGEDDWPTAEAKAALGACLAAFGRFEEAESFLREGYAVFQAERSEGQSETRRIRQALFALYTAWGKPERAAAYRAETP